MSEADRVILSVQQTIVNILFYFRICNTLRVRSRAPHPGAPRPSPSPRGWTYVERQGPNTRTGSSILRTISTSRTGRIAIRTRYVPYNSGAKWFNQPEFSTRVYNCSVTHQYDHILCSFQHYIPSFRHSGYTELFTWLEFYAGEGSLKRTKCSRLGGMGHWGAGGVGSLGCNEG